MGTLITSFTVASVAAVGIVYLRTGDFGAPGGLAGELTVFLAIIFLDLIAVWWRSVGRSGIAGRLGLLLDAGRRPETGPMSLSELSVLFAVVAVEG